MTKCCRLIDLMMNLRTFWLLGVMIGVCALTSTAYGQPEGASPQPIGARQANPNDEAFLAAQKEAFVEWLIAREEWNSGRVFEAGFRAQAKQALLSLPVEVLEAQKSQDGLGPLVVGDTQADLVYTPVTPCRILDTRLAGGPIAANSTRSIKVTGDTTSQGGANCGIPFGAATAAEINFVAVNPVAPGDLRVTPFGTPMPLASILNWAGGVAGLNLANGVSVKLCNPATTSCTNDITLQADVSPIDIVADVQGFYRRLDGSVLTRAISAEPFVNSTTSPVNANLLTGVVAPTAGGLLVNIAFNCASFIGTTNTRWDVVPRVDGVNHSGMVLFFPHAVVAFPNAGANSAATFFHPVEAGTHTISYSASRSAGDGSLDCNLFASSHFVPFNNAGGTP